MPRTHAGASSTRERVTRARPPFQTTIDELASSPLDLSVPIPTDNRWLPFRSLPFGDEVRQRMQAFLDDHNVRIHVDGGDRCLNRAGGIARARSQRMQLIDQAGNVGGKGVAFGMNILTDIDATRAQMRQFWSAYSLIIKGEMSAP